MANAETFGFDWSKFRGSREALKWNRRDLSSLDRVLSIVPRRTACVQAGGHLGVFAKYLARVFGSVLTFEPSADLFPKLTANAPEANIVRLQAALGDTPAFIGTRCERRGKPGIVHEGLTHVHGGGIVPTVRLDDLKLPALDLLCLDLEGFELHALRGAEETIAHYRPVLMVEINENCRHYDIAPEDVRTFMTDLGYLRVFTVNSDEVYTHSAGTPVCH